MEDVPADSRQLRVDREREGGPQKQLGSGCLGEKNRCWLEMFSYNGNLQWLNKKRKFTRVTDRRAESYI